MIFRYVIYIDNIVKRPVSSGNIVHITVSILTISVILQTLSIFLFIALIKIGPYLFSYDLLLYIKEQNNSYSIIYNYEMFSLSKFILNHYLVSLSYVVLIFSVAIFSAILFGFLARRNRYVGGLLFGQLSSILSEGKNTSLSGFVLTKISNGHKHIMYSGFVAEVAFKDGSDIDHIVLRFSEKFYFKMNPKYPGTTFLKSRPVSDNPLSSGLMYISGAEIENVHFDHYHFPRFKSP